MTKRGRPQIKNSKFECPDCGSRDTVKNGFNHSGSQRIRCRKCERRFTPDSFFERKPHDKPIMKVFPHRPLPSVDSIIGIPCFGCPIQPCLPETCEKLTNYLIEQVEFEKIKEKAEIDRSKDKLAKERLTIFD